MLILQPAGVNPAKVWLTPGVDFTNILQVAFSRADTNSAKRQYWLDCLFALLRSAFLKAAHKHIGEIDTRSCFKLSDKLL